MAQNPSFTAGSSSSSSTEPPPQDDQEHNKINIGKLSKWRPDQIQKARSFIKLVHDTINDTFKFRNFLQVLIDFKHRRISEAEVCKRVKVMLKDYPILLFGFSASYMSIPPPDDDHDCQIPRIVLMVSEDEVRKRVIELLKHHPNLLTGFSAFTDLTPAATTSSSLEEAIRFMEKVKIRFQNNQQIYKTFLQLLLNNYGSSEKSMGDLYKEVCNLFRGNDDLIQEFFESILPSSVLQETS